MPVLALNALGCLADGCQPEGPGRERGAPAAGPPAHAWSFTLAPGRCWSTAGRASCSGRGRRSLALVLYAFQPTFLGHGKQVTSDVAGGVLHDRRRLLLLEGAARTAAMRGRSRPARGGRRAGLEVHGRAARSRSWPARWRCHGARRRSRTARRAAVASSIAPGDRARPASTPRTSSTAASGPPRAYTWQSEAFRRHAPCAGCRSRCPRTFVLGLDYSRCPAGGPRTSARGPNYVLGELNRDGRWYAFPLMILLKTPLAIFALLALAVWPPRPAGVRRVAAADAGGGRGRRASASSSTRSSASATCCRRFPS